ncbi:protein kinase superfamily protein [Actinidia rufa]|uniref:non-specific serine/threonine protein kinase n=1 Tax=Actinidia rufa TaxID=165716 RepID=A0A7J0EIK0_9ERIC|nr:protein kinase superfamily protein [Actinidia rufa]
MTTPTSRSGKGYNTFSIQKLGNIKQNITEIVTGPHGGGSAVVQDLPASGRIVTPNLKMFTYSELKNATRNFRPDTVVGEGGFGRVFKGWVDDKTYAPSKVGIGIAVAVKKSNPDSCQGFKEWQSEVKFLGKFSHPNLVKLIGYCWEDKQFLLVYEYMTKGSLESHLFTRAAEPLSWHTRLKIAIGAAKGLSFLHTTEGQVIYRDFKSANILLDGDFNAKLSDFGLAKLGPADGNSHVTTGVVGTYGYAAPEYINTEDQRGPQHQGNPRALSLKPKLDVQLTGEKPVTFLKSSPKYSKIRPWLLSVFIMKPDPKDRPSMEQVLETLQQINAIKMKPKESKANGKHKTTHLRQQNTANSHHHSYGHNRSPLHHHKYGGNGGGAGSRPRSPLH